MDIFAIEELLEKERKKYLAKKKKLESLRTKRAGEIVDKYIKKGDEYEIKKGAPNYDNFSHIIIKEIDDISMEDRPIVYYMLNRHYPNSPKGYNIVSKEYIYNVLSEGTNFSKILERNKKIDSLISD
jgi:hypothetical protein